MTYRLAKFIFFASLSASGPVAAQGMFGKGNCAVVVASRETVSEARNWIYQNGFAERAKVYESSNGWYAITVGVIESYAARDTIDAGVRRNLLPSDAYCSSGASYRREVNWSVATQPVQPPSEDLFDEFDARPLTRIEKRFVQAALAREGYYSGLLDGVWGNGSQSSLENYTRQVFEHEPMNADAAYLAITMQDEIESEGWKQKVLDGLAMGIIMPTKNMVLKEVDGINKTWEHSYKNIELITDDFTTAQTRASHRYLEQEAIGTNSLYKVRDRNRWVTSLRKNGATSYLRSDLIQGTWSTIFVLGTDEYQGEVSLMISSISQDKMDDFMPNSSGVLMRNARLLRAEIKKSREEGSTTPNADSSRREPTTPKEPRSNGTGTGFVINNEGVLITNAHVIEDCSSVKVNGRYAEVLASSSTFDLAAISVPNAQLGDPLKFASDSVGLNADITIAGYPLHGLLGGLNVSRGSISALKGLRGDETTLQISAPVQPGNSGGPAVDRFGNVVGVVVSKLNAVELADLTGDIAQNVNFAVRGDLAKVFLSSNGIAYLEMPDAAPIDAEGIAQRLQSSTHLIECLQN